MRGNGLRWPRCCQRTEFTVGPLTFRAVYQFDGDPELAPPPVFANQQNEQAAAQPNESPDEPPDFMETEEADVSVAPADSIDDEEAIAFMESIEDENAPPPAEELAEPELAEAEPAELAEPEVLPEAEVAEAPPAPKASPKLAPSVKKPAAPSPKSPPDEVTTESEHQSGGIDSFLGGLD